MPDHTSLSGTTGVTAAQPGAPGRLNITNYDNEEDPFTFKRYLTVSGSWNSTGDASGWSPSQAKAPRFILPWPGRNDPGTDEVGDGQ